VSERADPRPQGVQQDVGRVLQNGFYAGSAPSTTEPIQEVASKRDAKPSHYKVICISMYTDDLKRLDGMVEALKARGLTKANRSALIRYALGEVDLDRVPKGL
jgi:hypothetical protein